MAEVFGRCLGEVDIVLLLFLYYSEFIDKLGFIPKISLSPLKKTTKCYKINSSLKGAYLSVRSRIFRKNERSNCS